MTTPDFARRHIGPSPEETQQMLDALKVQSLDALIDQTVPASIRMQEPLDIAPALSESDYLRHVQGLASKNQVFRNFIGLGYHPTATPSVIQRNILENPGWYTAYTPYQAEIAQGRMEALLNYQTMVVDLTGMELANASLLDEATAAAEAMTMLLGARTREQQKRNATKFFVDTEALPQVKSLLSTRGIPQGIELVEGTTDSFVPSDDFFGALIQYPTAFGAVKDGKSFVAACAEKEIQVAVAADLMSLALLTPPGEWGAAVVVGTSQRFGIPMGFGGPHAAYFATKEDYKRFIPGRIIGRTLDKDGNPALRMALQTREQHIKRDRATSNICTAQVLLSVMAGMYGVYHGPQGIRSIATSIHRKAVALNEALAQLGYTQSNAQFFDTLHLPADDALQARIRTATEARGINVGYTNGAVLVSAHEVANVQDLQDLVDAFAEAAGKATVAVNPHAAPALATHLLRTSDYLTHPAFNSYHSESEMMRYIKKLERKDLSLNHSMISLGSCTMKLNAASEMLPLSWPAWGQMHPFVPAKQAAGYFEVIAELERDLAIVTGFDATSLQPNSGAQGEYAGLMVIRAYHLSRGDAHRNVALIPSSAHGTNPASAVMAGMEVVVVGCDDRGNIDLADLQTKAEQYSDRLSCMMITYPSTHGVFEASVKEATALIHQHGGQVYMDGANMNAQVGLTSPGLIGADVCHLNLHKTFAIPHGGGGPGVGPICVKSQLAPFLPSHPVVATGGNQPITAISAAPYGSALVLLISYAYIKMLGGDGLREATRYAILNANYMKHRLETGFQVLYTGDHGRCAHEMILDCRPFKRDGGIEVVDLAKRLMDYGYHAPTVSFPVAGTLMIEPTESESKMELDRFCDALLAIRNEVQEVIDGKVDAENNVLKNAPHTLSMVTANDWTWPYTRHQAAYPLAYVAENKFWPMVRRVDEAYGDRNLQCTCAPVSSYAE